LRFAPLGALTGRAGLAAERSLGIANTEALAMALHVVNGALPLKAPSKPLGSRPEGVGEVGGLKPDRRLASKMSPLRENPLYRGTPLRLDRRDCTNPLARPLVPRAQPAVSIRRSSSTRSLVGLRSNSARRRSSIASARCSLRSI
jgi:hypothetical protein